MIFVYPRKQEGWRNIEEWKHLRIIENLFLKDILKINSCLEKLLCIFFFAFDFDENKREWNDPRFVFALQSAIVQEET